MAVTTLIYRYEGRKEGRIGGRKEGMEVKDKIDTQVKREE
jgi:hypothetical protein